jgi:hypothetical protein
MLSEGIPFEEALARVRGIRPVVSPNPMLFDRDLLERLRREREAILSPQPSEVA